MTTQLPKVDDAAPRRRRNVTQPAAAKKAKPAATKAKPAAAAKKPKAAPSPEQTDIVLRDQAERARQAREAALQTAAQPAAAEPERAVGMSPAFATGYGEPNPVVLPPADPTDPVVTPATIAPAAPVPPAAPAPLDTDQLIVNQELVDVLKAVKGTSLGDFEKFLHELYPLMELWSGALTEGAARRHALSIMLLIKERF